MKRTLLAVGSLALVSGCPHFYKLDVKNVTALDVSGTLADGSYGGKQLCARSGLVDVLATTKDGQKHEEGRHDAIDKNQFDPDLVQLTASVGTFTDRSWNPPEDPLAMLKVKSVTITAALKADPKIQAQAVLTPTWACDPPVWRGGGQDGQSGDQGDTASSTSGTGGDGGKGENGHNGLRSTVAIGWSSGPNGERLALAVVETEGLGAASFVLDPSTPLKVFATGGNGGAGGTGGFGGDTRVGKAGRGGHGGYGGDGGDGNSVLVRYDASDPSLAQLIVVDASGGQGGPGGYGGGGGAGLDQAKGGDGGPDGEVGRNGRDGSSRAEAVRGMNQNVAQLADASAAPATNQAPQAPPPQQQAGQPPRYTSANGARTYTGGGTLDATMSGQRPYHQHQSVTVISTRTQRHHFTIAFQGGSNCTLDFHRPPGETRHHYVLDAPATCPTPQLTLQVSSATLDLDTKTDQLALTWDGVGLPPRGGTAAQQAKLHFDLKAKRR